MSEVHVVDKEKIYFHPEQVKYLRKIFPVVVFGSEASHAELLHYNGQQMVLQFIEGRVR